MSKQSTMMIAAGGTGGHIIPALVIAHMFKEYHPQGQCLFVGTSQGMESALVPQHGYTLLKLCVGRIKGHRWFVRLRSIFLLPIALVQSLVFILRYRPRAVLGIGGYASGPFVLMASLLRIPTAILEPNVMPGLSNRLLSHCVRHICLAFPQAKPYFLQSNRHARGKIVVTGNPLRQSILDIAPPNFAKLKRSVLIFGGSQGAHRINQAVIDMLPLLKDHADRLQFIHQTGQQDAVAVSQAYRRFALSADVRVFFDDMADAYQRSDIVIARAGSSVLEIASCGRPSILIPYPHAADNHQTLNAQVLADIGAARIIADRACTGSSLCEILLPLLDDSEALTMMSQAALSLRQENSGEHILATLKLNGREPQ